VHQQEHASPLINCNDVNASIALVDCSPARDGGEGLAGAGTYITSGGGFSGVAGVSKVCSGANPGTLPKLEMKSFRLLLATLGA